jgi:hypothetical protein
MASSGFAPWQWGKFDWYESMTRGAEGMSDSGLTQTYTVDQIRAIKSAEAIRPMRSRKRIKYKHLTEICLSV